MLNAVVCKDSQFCSYTDTVVGSQRCTFGFQPFPFNYGFYRVGEEVVLHIVVLFAHHVDVRLQHYGLTVLHTRCSGLFDEDVAGFVNQCFQLMFFTECFQISNHFLFLLRRTRHLADFIEIMKNACRFQFILFHINSFMNVRI